MKILIMGILKLVGFVSFQVIRLGVMAFAFGAKLVLDHIYGKPQIGTLSVTSPSPKVSSVQAGDFKPTVQLEPVAVKAASAVPIATPPMQVVRQADPIETRSGAEFEIADRVRTAELVGPEGVVYGKMWLYLYTAKRRARRVMKIHDPHLASVLGRERFYLSEVDFDPAAGYKVLLTAMHEECKILLNKRRVTHEPRRKVKQQPAAERIAPVAAASPVERVTAPIVKPERPAASVAAAPVAPSAAAAPAWRRRVGGDEYTGTVASAGKTKRGEGERQYTTFCLTINDGTREVPLFGTELERQAADLGITAGDKVRVVYMGRAPVPGESGNTYKNLYQLTRMEAS